MEVGVDALLRQGRANLVDIGGHQRAQRLALGQGQALQVPLEARQVADHPATIAAGGAVAEAPGLEHLDVLLRCQALEVIGGPQAGEATADNDHVCLLIADLFVDGLFSDRERGEWVSPVVSM